MYLWLCTSQTHSDILAGPRSNGRWYFKETIKQFESSESNYEWEPATLPKDLDLHPGRPPGKVPVLHSLFITLSLGLFSVSSEFSHLHLSQLYGICSNQEAVTLKLTLHGSGCLYDFLPIETRAHLRGSLSEGRSASLFLFAFPLQRCRSVDARNAHRQPGHPLSAGLSKWEKSSDTPLMGHCSQGHTTLLLLFSLREWRMSENAKQPCFRVIKQSLNFKRLTHNNTSGLHTQILHEKKGPWTLPCGNRTHKQHRPTNAHMEMYNPEQIHLAWTRYRNAVRMQILGWGEKQHIFDIAVEKTFWRFCSFVGQIPVPSAQQSAIRWHICTVLGNCFLGMSP